MAENESGPAVRADRALESVLLTRLFDNNSEKLNAEVKRVQDENGGNRLSALRTIRYTMGTTEVPGEHNLTGYYLQTYQRAERAGNDDRGFSTYLATRDGVETLHFNNRDDIKNAKETNVSFKEFGQPQSWRGIRQVRDRVSDSTFLSVVPGTTRIALGQKSEIGRNMWELSKPATVENINDQLDIWHGYCSGIKSHTDFGEAEPNPLLGTGGEASMDVIVVADVDHTTGQPRRNDPALFIELTTESQVRALLGEQFNEQELTSEEGFRTIRSGITGVPVIIFGSGLTKNSKTLNAQYRERMKNPKIKMTNGLGCIIPFPEEQ